MSRRKLYEIAEIQLGYTFRGKIKPAQDGSHRVIQGKDIDNTGVLHTDEIVRTNFDKVRDRYILKEGDVIFLAKSQRNVAALVHLPLQTTIPTSSIFIVRVKDKSVLPEYISWWINQEEAQSYFQNNRRGVYMPIIGRKELEDMDIEIPPLKTQKRIVEVNRLMNQESELLRQIEEKRWELVRGMCKLAIKDKQKS